MSKLRPPTPAILKATGIDSITKWLHTKPGSLRHPRIKNPHHFANVICPNGSGCTRPWGHKGRCSKMSSTNPTKKNSENEDTSSEDEVESSSEKTDAHVGETQDSQGSVRKDSSQQSNTSPSKKKTAKDHENCSQESVMTSGNPDKTMDGSQEASMKRAESKPSGKQKTKVDGSQESSSTSGKKKKKKKRKSHGRLNFDKAAKKPKSSESDDDEIVHHIHSLVERIHDKGLARYRRRLRECEIVIGKRDEEIANLKNQISTLRQQVFQVSNIYLTILFM